MSTHGDPGARAGDRAGCDCGDAFSSDSVPVHLLTVEALQEFSRTLADGGVIAFHISNRFFDLQPVIAAAAEREGMTWAEQRHIALDLYDLTSTWVMAAKSSGAAASAGLTGVAWTPPPAAAAPWTDDWANVLGARKPWTNDNSAQ